MLEAAENLDFERAARLRDRMKELESAPTLEVKGQRNGANA
jgi:excinuclease UvrABC nuclease subunit